MSKIVITVDTDESTVSAKVDGQTYDNVNSVSIYKYVEMNEKETEVQCSICLEDEEAGDVTKRVMICTANSKEAKAILANEKAEIVTQNDSMVIAKMRKSMAEIISNVLKAKKSK